MLGESVHGFLLRVSSANALRSTGALKAEWADVLMARGEGRAHLRGPMTGSPHLANADADGLPGQYWNARRPRCCPLCLTERAAWCSLWELVFYTECHKHETMLLDKCGSCHHPLRWRRRELLRCSCGADFRLSRSEPSSPAALSISSELAKAWGDGAARDGSEHGGLTIEELLHRTWFLGAYGLRSSRRALKLGNLFDVEFARAVAASAVLPAEDWLTALFALFDEVAGQYGSPQSLRLTKRFGAFYKELFDPRWERALCDIREGFERYVTERWPGQLAARNRRLSREVRNAHMWVPLTRAAKELHWKMPRLRSAIERGVVRGHLVAHASGRTSGTIHRDDLAHLVDQVRDEMTLLEVCASLRVGKKALKSMVADGVLTPTSGPSVDGLTIWRFRRRDVEGTTRPQLLDTSGMCG
jgi:hypothetical protein